MRWQIVQGDGKGCASFAEHVMDKAGTCEVILQQNSAEALALPPFLGKFTMPCRFWRGLEQILGGRDQ